MEEVIKKTGTMRIKCKYCSKTIEITAENVKDRIGKRPVKCPICREIDCLKLQVLSEEQLEAQVS